MGGKQLMIDSPLLRNLLAEVTRQARRHSIILLLEGRFGMLSHALVSRINSVRKKEELVKLVKLTARCPDLASFEAHLPMERPWPASSRKTPRRRKPSTDH
jgi:hypothetical protein